MRRILEEFYRGNIGPNERAFVKDDPYANTMPTLDQNEAYLNERLEGKEKEAFTAFSAAQAALNTLTAEDEFITGFRLGMRMALAALSDNDGELRPLV